MASQGPLSAGTAANGVEAGITWATPTNVTASDDARATASLVAGINTRNLLVTQFVFSIPSGATIDGIVLEVERSVTTTALNPRDSVMQLVKDGSTPVGSNKASATVWPTTDAYATYGSVSDLWGTTWTDTEINASTFGLSLTAQRDTGKGAGTVRVDHIRITVHYTEAGGGGGTATARAGGDLMALALAAWDGLI